MRRDLEAGFTLIEAMIAMAILLVGAMGLMGIFTHGLKLNGDARRLMQASNIAEDIVNNIQARYYDDAVTQKLLANAKISNDGDIADTNLNFTTSPDPVADGWADHDEKTLDDLGTAWTGIPAASLGEFQRYWNVANLDTNGDGSIDEVQLAVIVRWPYGSGYRRVVLISGMLNPGRQ